MLVKQYLGLQESDFERKQPSDPISRVTIWYDDENAFTAGDDTGKTFEIDCPWATQNMANSILAKLKGMVYKPFEANDAFLDLSANVGDPVTVNGVYTIIGSIKTDYDGDLNVSTVTAPGGDELEDEYPYLNTQQRELTRVVKLGQSYYGTKITRANGLEIAKTEADGTQKSRVMLNSDVLAFYNDDGAEALYFDTNEGKFKFTGILNVADNFIVDANGNVKINGNINLSGGTITWGGNYPGVDLPDYLYSTYIGPTEIRSPEITGNNIRVFGTFQTLDPDGISRGYIGYGEGDASGNVTQGVMMSAVATAGQINENYPYVIVTTDGVRMTSGLYSMYVTNSGCFVQYGDDARRNILTDGSEIVAVFG